MVASEYGWLKEYILDMPICSLRQHAENIRLRVRMKTLREEGLLEWQTKVLAVYISATAMDGGKKLMQAAQQISLRDSSEDTATKAKDARASDPEVYVEQGSQVADNRTGSFEKLLGGFGGGPVNR